MGKPQEWRTVPGRCVNCTACRILVEGPRAGHCIYGGPFVGYQRYDEVTDSFSAVFTDPPKK